MSQITAASTHHNGYDFVVVLVKDRVIHDLSLRENVLAEAEQLFGLDPVLVGEQRLETYGVQRAVNMLRNIEIERLPWQEYRLN